MPLAATPISNKYPWGADWAQDFTLAMSGNYPDEGEAVTPATFGLANAIKKIIWHGPGVSLDGETAIVPHFNGIDQKIEFFEAAAAGTALTEKTAAEAYPALGSVNCTVVGY